MSSRVVKPIFPHNRLIGPSLMPFSVKTKEKLDDACIKIRNKTSSPNALFTGSLYEPRTTILKQIQKDLKKKGFRFEIKGRILGSARIDDGEYWSRLIDANIIVTTAAQMHQPGTDWTFIPHFLYRYLEVLVCGTLLIAEDVPGVQRFFIPGKHFVAFKSKNEAVDLIAFYLKNEYLREKIAKEGKRMANNLIASRIFWVNIDSSLGKDSIF